MTECLTPLSRIVWGNPTKSRQKRDDNNKPVFKDGQPVMETAFGLAIPVQEFVTHVWPHMYQEMASLFPSPPPNFSWKFKDGTGGQLSQWLGIPGNWAVDRHGKQYAEREGHAGCVILAVTTQLAVPMFKVENNQYVPWNMVKTGDYVQAKLNFKANKPTNATHKPSLFVNPDGVVWWYDGPEIRADADPDDMFGAPGAFAPPPMPPGASTAPRAPGMPVGGMPGAVMPGQPVPGAPMPGMPAAAPQYAPQPQPGYPQPAAPAYDFVTQQTGGVMPGQPAHPTAMPMAPVPGAAPMPGQPVPGMMPPAAGAYPSNPAAPQYAPQPQPMPGQPVPGMPGYVPGR